MNDFKPYVGRRVRLFTDFATIVGILERAGRDALTLEHAAVVAGDGVERPVDGEIVVPALQVQWMQVP